MPDFTILPNFQIVQALEAWWPRQEGNSLFANVNVAANSNAGLGAGGLANFLGTSGTVQGNVYPPAAGGAGLYSATVGNQAAGTSTMDIQEQYGSMLAVLRAADTPQTALINNEINRVWRVEWWQAATGAGIGTADDNTAVFFGPGGGLGLGQPFGGNPGFGVTMDGAGAYQYRNYQAGAFPGNIAETVAFPAGVVTDIAAWNHFDCQMIGGGPGRDASWDLVVNGTQIVSRNWVSGGGAELADYADGPGGLGMRIAGPQWVTNNTANANVALRVTQIHVTFGKFTRAGLEIEF